MEFAYKLIDILSKSVEKNGDKPLTTLHLLNIVKMCVKSVEEDEIRLQDNLDQALTEIYNSECGDRQ